MAGASLKHSDFEHSSHIAIPSPAAKNEPTAAQSRFDIELDDLHELRTRIREAREPNTHPSERSFLPLTPGAEPEGTEWVPDRTINPRKTRWRLFSACLMLFGNGMNDSAPGALIPYMEKHYDINYSLVSMIFVGNALGFIAAAPFTYLIEQKLGRAKSYTFSMFWMAVSYIVIICQPPFPVVVVCFFLLGFAVALNLALNNTWSANLANSTTALGLICGSYGIGGTVAPLFATAMESNGIRWSLFYTIPTTVSVINLVLATWAFSNFEQDILAEPQRVLEPDGEIFTEEDLTSRQQLLKKAIQNRTTLLGALFIFAYQGAEVSISGWVVSFLISYRDGDPARVGYVSSGFWAGITAGRFLLVQPASKIGEKITVQGMIIGSVIFQLMTWLIPNVIAEAVTVAVLGVMLGAVYPCATAVFIKLLPRQLHISSMSIVSALGSSGGAVWPLLTGILSQQVGTMVLHPICLGLYGFMTASWLLLPKISKRSE
ncbi:hypothetical protein N7452_001577 [Penicillium brevicompactum]|uniref:Major facilitator superfamily (MFS) profile domain-containing protein n=1 Tax=Penicillium brevicompactum TaxID=5074 RepID=A0A9W9R863_PENBR|nr:hypothetical protein N7452_001577 [Penicillium brevicompactum]